jgi:hypothetical protein
MLFTYQYNKERAVIKKTACMVLSLVFIIIFSHEAGAAMESASYKIPSTVLSGGGSPMSSASYTGNSTLGQPSPLMDPANPPTSTSYDNYPGFWYGAVIASTPTLIELTSFTASPFDRLIVLEWVTASEIDNAGFNLYRAEGEKGAYMKLNESLIPADGSPTEGATYQFIDDAVQNRITYYYRLEDIDLSGKSTMHGSINATPRRTVK